MGLEAQRGGRAKHRSLYLPTKTRGVFEWLTVRTMLARKSNRGRSARGRGHGNRTPFSGRTEIGSTFEILLCADNPTIS